MTLASKEELIHQCKNKNRQAQLLLYDEVSRFLFTVSNRIVQDEMLANDIMQETLIDFFEKSIYQLKNADQYQSYLKRIVTNKSIDKWKRKEYFADLETVIEHEEEEEQASYSWEEVLKQLQYLPEKYRIMIELYYLQEYSHKEISEILGISYSNSRVLLKRAIDKLKKQVL